MYIIYHTEGQTCNQYFQYLYYLRLSIKEGKKLRVMFPDITLGDYTNLSSRNDYISFPLYFKWVSSIIGKRTQIKLIHKIYKKLLGPNICKAISFITCKKILFVDGTSHWNDNINYKDLTPILSFLFKPNNMITEKVDALFENCQQKYIVGIHIRGGDYRQWRGGRFFFEPEVYYQYMNKMVDLLKTSINNVIFYISTNEPIDLKKFKGLNCKMINNATAVEDLYALSKCNYIIGTVSTFSGWASFVNRIPRFYFTSKEKINNLTLDDFSIPRNNLVDFTR